MPQDPMQQGQPAQPMPAQDQPAEPMESEESEGKTGKGGGELKEKFDALVNSAKGMIYGNGFEPMIQLFQQNGKKGFADAMGMVVPGVLEELEKRHGKQDNKMLLMVAFALVAMITTDLTNGQILQDIDAQDTQLAMGMVLSKWMEGNPDRGGMEKAMQLLDKEAKANKAKGGGMGQGDMAGQPQQTGVMGAV